MPSEGGPRWRKHPNLTTMDKNSIRRGWRSFLCDGCGHKFEWPTRDHRSPSGENCPECGGWVVPRDSWHDETLKVDDMGNLTYDLDIDPL